MYDSLERKHLSNMTDKFHVLQQDYDTKAEDAEDEDEKLLTQRQDVEQLRFMLDQKKEQSRIHHKELYATPLYADGKGEQTRFYAREDISSVLAAAGKEDPGPAWFIKSYASGVVGLETGGKVIGKVPSGLPGFDWSVIMHLIGVMITISLIGFMESISIAKAMAAKTRQNLSPDGELIGQGMGNIVGSVFQAYPVSGSFSRSAVNINAGAVIIKAVSGLISIRPMIHAWRANRHDGIVTLFSHCRLPPIWN